MKILYYSPHPYLNLMSPAGFGTHMRGMITAFRNKKCEVHTVIMGGETNPPDPAISQESNNFKSLLKKATGKNIWRTLKDFKLLRFDRTASDRLEEAIKKYEPDFIYERTNYLQLSGIKEAKKYGIVHVSEINTPYVDQQNYLSKSRSYLEKYARGIEKKQLQGTDLALAVVGPLQDHFCSLYDLDPGKFLITHDAFDKDTIRLNPENQQKIERQYKLFDKRLIGYVGSIFEWHGLDKLIKAFYEINNPKTKLLIVGYGEYMTNLTELVISLGIEEKVIFTGGVPKEEVFDYINVMDICAAPNAAWYQSPIKIFEYGAMGKPILAPDTAAVREVMEPEQDGVLVKPEVESIKEGLLKLLNNEEEASQMGKYFQRKVLEKYTWEANAEKVLQAIKRL